MDFIVIIIIISTLYCSTSLFLINVHTLCHLIISDWKNTISLEKKKRIIAIMVHDCTGFQNF